MAGVPASILHKDRSETTKILRFFPSFTFYLILGGALFTGLCMGGATTGNPVARVAFSGVGSIIFLSGLSIAIWARWGLGIFWSPSQAEVKLKHRVIKGGAYKYVRHPIYVGEILMALGTSIWSMNWLLTMVLFGGMTLYNYYRARTEEVLLGEELGDEYREYQRNVPLLIPKRGSYWKE